MFCFENWKFFFIDRDTALFQRIAKVTGSYVMTPRDPQNIEILHFSAGTKIELNLSFFGLFPQTAGGIYVSQGKDICEASNTTV